jgi:hypothetical protein
VIDTPGFPPGDSLQSLPRDEYLNITPRKPIDHSATEKVAKQPKQPSPTTKRKNPTTSTRQTSAKSKKPVTKAKTQNAKTVKRGVKKR